MMNFLKDAQHELSQVTWLTKNQAIKISMITVIFVIASAVVLWGVDTIFTELYKLVQ